MGTILAFVSFPPLPITLVLAGVFWPYWALALLSAEAFAFCGAWLLTTPAPRAIPGGESQVLRRSVRGLYGTALTTAALYVSMMASGRGPLPVIFVVSAVLILGRLVLLLAYLRGLARHVPGSNLAWTTETTGVSLVACGACAAAFMLGEAWGLTALAAVFFWLSVIGFVYFGVWSLILFCQYAARFRSMARSGRDAYVR